MHRKAGRPGCSHQLLPAQKPYSESCLVCFEGRMLHVMLLKPTASSGHACRTVLPSTGCSERLAHCHEPGNVFFLLSLDEVQFILASHQQEKPKKAEPACAPAWLQSTLTTLPQEPSWFLEAGRSSLSPCSCCRTLAAIPVPQGKSPLFPKGESLKGRCNTDGDTAFTARNSGAAATSA